MKILLPNQNYSSGMNFSVQNEVVDYEIERAFSPDTDEYAKITSGSYTYMDYTGTNSGTPALLMLSDSYNLQPGLETDTSGAFSTPTVMNISASYGDYLQLREYSNNPGENYFRVSLGSGSTEEIRAIVYGRTYDLPSGNTRLEAQSESYKYFKSKTYVNLAGIVKYSGLQTHLRRKHKLRFEYLNSTDKDMLLSIFLASKGSLPVWFIDDEADESTWRFVILKEMIIKEPHAGYFSVEISMEEL